MLDRIKNELLKQGWLVVCVGRHLDRRGVCVVFCEFSGIPSQPETLNYFGRPRMYWGNNWTNVYQKLKQNLYV